MRIFSEGDIALVLDLGARVNLHGIKFWESKLDNFIAAYTGDKVISARMLDHKWEEMSTRASLLIHDTANPYSFVATTIEINETLHGSRRS